MTIEEKLEQGIEAAQLGHKVEARNLLTEVVTADEDQIEAWLWLSQLVDSMNDKIVCLENVLTLEPHNQFAQEELANVKVQQEKFFSPIYPPGQEEPPAQAVKLSKAAKKSVTTEYPHQDEFDNPWLCPYCTKLTQSKDRRCRHCRKPLIIKQRTKKERSTWLWRGIFLQISALLIIISLGSTGFIILIRQQGIANPTLFVPLYFGAEIEAQWQSFSQTVFDAFPIWAFWGMIGIIVYTIGMIFLLYIRIPYGNLLYLISAAISLMLGLVGMIVFYNSMLAFGLSGFALLLGLVQFVVSFNLWNDFTFKEYRIQMRADRDAKTHTGFFHSGRKYSKMGMWGLAVLHLRRAVAANPQNAAYHLALTLAYLNIKRYKLADKSLTRFAKLDPQAKEIEPLRKEIRQVRN